MHSRFSIFVVSLRQKITFMSYCQYCGNSNNDAARFCSKCGSSLETGTQQATVDEQPKSSYAETQQATVHEQPENPYAYKPSPTQQQAPSMMPPTYLWQSIVVTILCCLPLGIPAIVFATQVQSQFLSGDIEGARSASNKAKNFCIWSLVLGIIAVFISFLAGIGSAILENL